MRHSKLSRIAQNAIGLSSESVLDKIASLPSALPSAVSSGLHSASSPSSLGQTSSPTPLHPTLPLTGTARTLEQQSSKLRIPSLSTRSVVTNRLHDLSREEIEELVAEYELHTSSSRVVRPDPSAPAECSISGHYVGNELFFEALGRSSDFASFPKRFQKNSVIISVRDPLTATDDPAQHGLVPFLPSYLVAYRFGCVVFFNVATDKKEEYITLCSRFTAEPFLDEQAKEELTITVVKAPVLPAKPSPSSSPSVGRGFASSALSDSDHDDPDSPQTSAQASASLTDDLHARTTSAPSPSPSASPAPSSRGGSLSSASGIPHNPVSLVSDPATGVMTVQSLDEATARVIGTVLAQSVALEHYARLVDRFLNEFSAINRFIVQDGRLPSSFVLSGLQAHLTRTRVMTKKELMRKIAQTNLLLSDILLKIKVLDRCPDLAWKDPLKGSYWDYIRQDLEMRERFETLMQKVSLVQDDVKFLLDVVASDKSERLEKIIIFLISVEIFIGLWGIATGTITH